MTARDRVTTTGTVVAEQRGHQYRVAAPGGQVIIAFRGGPVRHRWLTVGDRVVVERDASDPAHGRIVALASGRE